MDYTAIDGDMVDFIAAQREVSNTFSVSELRQFLLNEGHPDDDVAAALGRWETWWFVLEEDSFRLTAEGQNMVDLLSQA